jgi:hypothetical protein
MGAMVTPLIIRATLNLPTVRLFFEPQTVHHFLGVCVPNCEDDSGRKFHHCALSFKVALQIKVPKSAKKIMAFLLASGQPLAREGKFDTFAAAIQ